MLTAPAWAKHAVPTPRGWKDPKTGELLVSRTLSDRQIAEWHSHKSAQGMTKPVEGTPAPKPEPIIEADPVEDHVHDYNGMTKADLAEHAAAVHGVELDTSMTKAQMIEELEAQL